MIGMLLLGRVPFSGLLRRHGERIGLRAHDVFHLFQWAGGGEPGLGHNVSSSHITWFVSFFVLQVWIL